MSPIDHLVRFYNEIFKYPRKQGPEAAAEYCRTVSRHQETHCLKLFTEKGIPGMAEHRGKIYGEENGIFAEQPASGI